MCSANRSSLEVSFLHLGQGPAILAIWLADVPKEMLNIFDEVLTEAVMGLYPDYNSVRDTHIICLLCTDIILYYIFIYI